MAAQYEKSLCRDAIKSWKAKQERHHVHVMERERDVLWEINRSA